VKPPGGAAPFSVTVPVPPVPPVTEVGVRLTPLTEGACTVRVAVFELPPTVPVIVTGVLVATGEVVIVKLFCV